MKKELTMEEKWAPVDRILKDINDREKNGKRGCRTDLEEYINHNFNK